MKRKIKLIIKRNLGSTGKHGKTETSYSLWDGAKKLILETYKLREGVCKSFTYLEPRIENLD